MYTVPFISREISYSSDLKVMLYLNEFSFVFLFVGNGILIGRVFFLPRRKFYRLIHLYSVCFWWMKSKGKKNIYIRWCSTVYGFSYTYTVEHWTEPSSSFYFCCSFVPNYTPSVTWKCCLLVMFKLAVAICCGPFCGKSFSTSDLLGRTYGNLEHISWRFWMIFILTVFMK